MNSEPIQYSPCRRSLALSCSGRDTACLGLHAQGAQSSARWREICLSLGEGSFAILLIILRAQVSILHSIP